MEAETVMYSHCGENRDYIAKKANISALTIKIAHCQQLIQCNRNWMIRSFENNFVQSA